MASVQNFNAAVEVNTLGARSFNLTVGSGANRKIVIAILCESATVVFSSVTFNGNAASSRVSRTHDTNTAVRGFLYTYDVPDALDAGSYAVAFSSDETAASTTLAWQLLGVATGAPEATSTGSQASASATVSGTAMSVTEGSVTVAAVVNSASTPTYNSYGGNLVERQENNESAMTTTCADCVQSVAGSITISATASSTSTDKIILGASFAAAAAYDPIRLKRNWL